jgi:hypothetical protein
MVSIKPQFKSHLAYLCIYNVIRKRTYLLQAFDGSNNQVHQELTEEFTSTTNQKISE